MSTQRRTTSRRKQSGIVAIVMTIAMLALLSVTALAIDINHLYMNRTKLQNGVDAAALAAAVVLDNNSSQSDAITAVNETLTKLVSTNGNSELDLESASINVTFNSTAAFDGGSCTSGGDCYVRVVVNNMDLQSYFMQLFTDTKQIAASAVAGPSAAATTVCNIAPLTVCALDDSDNENGGFSDGDEIAIKVASTNDDIGPGNFQLVDFDDEVEGLTTSEKNTHLREMLAGSYNGCATLEGTITTKPGNTVGPVGQGLNTRFGDSSGAIKGDYESDLNITEDITYSDYKSGDNNGRRMLLIPMIDCDNPIDNGNGKSEFPITALGCFFMKNKAPTSNSGKESVDGEFVTDGCEAANSYSNGQSSMYGPYRIVLYKDPLNEDS